jgi:hypothetical protein
LAQDGERVMVRLSSDEFAMLDALCESANVGLGGLLRECGLRYGAQIIREVQEGQVVIRRRDAKRPATRVARSKPKTTPAIRRASELIPESQEQYFLEHQAKLNEARDRASKGRK